MNKPLRICMITTFYPPYNFGGDGIFVKRLSNGLAEHGHKVEVIHCLDSYNLLASKKIDEDYADHPNVTVHGIKSPFGRLSPIATQQTGAPLFKSDRVQKILAKGFDVIHYHNISLFGPKILEYGTAIKLYTMHEYWLVCPTHVLFKHNREVCLETNCFSCSLSHKRPPQLWRYTGLLEKAVKNVDAFIALCKFGEETHRRMNLNVPIVHLPSFVPELPVMEEGEMPVQPEPYFLFVGRLEKLKGLQTLIPFFRDYAGAKLLVAGTGSLEKSLRREAAGSDNVRFLGQQSELQLQNLYRQALALIVPSLCYEMFALVILESFRQQTPVIARNLGGVPEIIHDSGGGILYDSQDELAAAIDRIVKDPEHRDQLGLRGYEAVQKKYTIERHLENYLALIQTIAARKSRDISPCIVAVPEDYFWQG